MGIASLTPSLRNTLISLWWIRGRHKRRNLAVFMALALASAALTIVPMGNSISAAHSARTRLNGIHAQQKAPSTLGAAKASAGRGAGNGIYFRRPPAHDPTD